MSSRSSRLRSWYYFVSHTKPSQIFSRVQLILKRKVMAKLSAWGVRMGAAAPQMPAPQASDRAPLPVFAARNELIENEVLRYVRLLNHSYCMNPPVHWHPPELEHGTRLEKLNIHYMEYAEGVDDEWFAALVVDWVERNPPYRPGYWLDDWNCYALSIRCVVWMQQLAARGAKIDEATRETANDSLAQQMRFLANNLELDIGGNHLIRNIRCLLWAAAYFSGPEATGWGDLGKEYLARELRAQVLSDGFHFERSPAYHIQVFADLLDGYRALEPGSSRDRLKEALRGMARVVVDTTHPDGNPSLFNDGGLNMAYSPREALAAFSELVEPAPMPRSVFSFPAAGFFGARRGDELLVVDCGPAGPDELMAHAHGDILAFEWSLGAQRVVVDAGVYEYHPGEWRAYSRSTKAHNTVTLDDLDQCEFWKAFRVGRRARVELSKFEETGEGCFELVGSHSGYEHLEGSPRHERSFCVDEAGISVSDRVTGGAGQSARARLLLHPDAEVEIEEGGARIRIADYEVRLETSVKVSIEDAHWCPDFGTRIPAPRVVLDYGAAPCEASFRLLRVS